MADKKKHIDPMQKALNEFSKLSPEEKAARIKTNKKFADKMQSSAPVSLLENAALIETVFSHKPSLNDLYKIGISETNETDYLARIQSQDKEDAPFTILFDLSAYFNAIRDTKELERINALLDKAGAFSNDFNE